MVASISFIFFSLVEVDRPRAERRASPKKTLLFLFTLFPRIG